MPQTGSLSSDAPAMKFSCERSLSEEAAVGLAGESWGGSGGRADPPLSLTPPSYSPPLPTTTAPIGLHSAPPLAEEFALPLRLRL